MYNKEYKLSTCFERSTDMSNTATRASIRELFNTEETTETRRSLSLSLPEALLKDLDEISETIASINGKHVTRQSLIESAIDAYVADFKSYLKEQFGVKVQTDYNEEGGEINTLIVPAHEDGISTLLNNEWYWLRIGKDKLDKIKYLAVYFGSPVSAITHIAKVEKLTKHPSGYKAQLSEVTELDHAICLGDLNPLYVRPNRYVSRERLLAAHTYADLVDLD